MRESTKMHRRKGKVSQATLCGTVACPKCGAKNRTTAVAALRVEMRPVLTETVPSFPEALAQAFVVGCFHCGYRICLHYCIELDDNPELDLNEKSPSGCK